VVVEVWAMLVGAAMVAEVAIVAGAVGVVASATAVAYPRVTCSSGPILVGTREPVGKQVILRVGIAGLGCACLGAGIWGLRIGRTESRIERSELKIRRMGIEFAGMDAGPPGFAAWGGCGARAEVAGSLAALVVELVSVGRWGFGVGVVSG